MRADFLVIGSGIAGLRAAVDLAAFGSVIVLTKAAPSESNTEYAQGGIAAAVGDDDSPEQHAIDTVAAGDGLCDPAAVDVLVRDGVERVRDLMEWGARFDVDPDGKIALGREGAHSVRRVLHAADATGRELGRVLWDRAVRTKGVQVLHHTRATALLLDDAGCRGARYVDRNGSGIVQAPATLLATGGAGQVYKETTNPPVATGDGIALAWRGGARVADLEFVQFHPTALSVAGAPRFLLSEALRGEGAWLLNTAGERFMVRETALAELASRDVVARAIVREAERTSASTYLSFEHLDGVRLHERFPVASRVCRSVGLDLARDRIPVMPAAHYQMGGVETDLWGRTTVESLFAAGEVACTGVHGANRLASNSLLEGLVFGARAAVAMRQSPARGSMANVREASADDAGDLPEAGSTYAERRARTGGGPDSSTSIGIDAEVPEQDEVRTLMWHRVGLARNGAQLSSAVSQLGRWAAAIDRRVVDAAHDEQLSRLGNIVLVGWLIARAALRRTETRGGHHRIEFPARDDVHWQVHISERKRVQGRPV